MAVTWNPSDKGGDVTLSGGDRTATIASGSEHGVRSTTSKSAGKFYFEVTLGTNGAFGQVGLANASSDMANGSAYPHNGADAIAYSAGAGAVIQNSTAHQSGLATATAGDIIGVAYDADGDTVQFYKNNVALGSADTHMPSGALFAYVSGGGGGGAGTVSTVNFGDSAFTYTPPGGFSAWSDGFVLAMTGGVSVGGEAAVFPPPAHPITGGVSVGSDFTIEVRGTFIHAMTGGVKLGGEAAILETHPTPTDPHFPVGGVVWGGGALISEVIPYFPSPSGVVWGGQAIIQDNINVVPTGGVVWGGTVTPITLYRVPVSGGFVFGGSAEPVTKYALNVSGGVVWGGESAATFRESIFFPSGGVRWGGSATAYMVDSDTVVTPENPYGDTFPGWMVNVENNAASRYLGLPANSITQFGGKTYVSNAAGVYEITSNSDAGQPIKSSVEFPTTDFQNSREKRMEVAYVGIKTTGRMKLKLMVNGYAPLYFFLMPSSDKHKGTRIPIGKGMVGRYWGARIDNVKGCDFSIESAEFKPVAGQRHGA